MPNSASEAIFLTLGTLAHFRHFVTLPERSEGYVLYGFYFSERSYNDVLQPAPPPDLTLRPDNNILKVTSFADNTPGANHNMGTQRSPGTNFAPIAKINRGIKIYPGANSTFFPNV